MSNAANKLITFWSHLDVHSKPFVHPQDRMVLNEPRNARRISKETPVTPEEWMTAAREAHVHLGLLPAPYIGNLRQADILVCLLNPGLAAVDFYAEQHQSAFRQKLLSTIRQEGLADTEYPFFEVDPAFCWSGAYRWWMAKLQDLIAALASRYFDNDFPSANRALSRRLAVLEMFPYHSTSFGLSHVLDDLPSAQLARQFAHEAAKEGRLVILTRQTKRWALPPGENVISYTNGEARGASLSRKSRGGKAIIKRFEQSE